MRPGLADRTARWRNARANASAACRGTASPVRRCASDGTGHTRVASTGDSCDRCPARGRRVSPALADSTARRGGCGDDARLGRRDGPGGPSAGLGRPAVLGRGVAGHRGGARGGEAHRPAARGADVRGARRLSATGGAGGDPRPGPLPDAGARRRPRLLGAAGERAAALARQRLRRDAGRPRLRAAGRRPVSLGGAGGAPAQRLPDRAGGGGGRPRPARLAAA